MSKSIYPKNMDEIVLAFQEFANQFPNGYLKEWKARSILCWTIEMLNNKESAMTEEEYFKKIDSCLGMEGFTNYNSACIAEWAWNKFKKDEE